MVNIVGTRVIKSDSETNRSFVFLPLKSLQSRLQWDLCVGLYFQSHVYPINTYTGVPRPYVLTLPSSLLSFPSSPYSIGLQVGMTTNQKGPWKLLRILYSGSWQLTVLFPSTGIQKHGGTRFHQVSGSEKLWKSYLFILTSLVRRPVVNTPVFRDSVFTLHNFYPTLFCGRLTMNVLQTISHVLWPVM